jgi:ATP-dependent RNA helicase RhlE
MEFKELNIIAPILGAIEKSGYINPTPIQEQTIPLLLEGKDVIGIAQTGTGKTAAFAIPILQKLHETKSYGKEGTPRALILAPTRELAAQITESFTNYGSLLNLKHMSIYGGVSMYHQKRDLRHGVDILIATPGRLMDLMDQGEIDFRRIEFLVLDEADRMLDMGFVKDIKKIVSSLPETKQSLFFSATMSKQVTDLTGDFLKDPIRVEVTPEATPVGKIEQCVFFIDNEDKNELLLDLIKQQNINKSIVFVGMKHKADKIVRILRNNGITSDAIHGDKSQYQRNKALKDFTTGKARILVATDIAARGIDIKDISHIINYDLPNESENYIHRIGRTARAGKEGTAYSFCCATDRNFLNQIERVVKKRIEQAEHKYHSIKAKSAEGADARPAPRGGRRQSSGKGRDFKASRNRIQTRDGRGRNSRNDRGERKPERKYEDRRPKREGDKKASSGPGRRSRYAREKKKTEGESRNNRTEKSDDDNKEKSRSKFAKRRGPRTAKSRNPTRGRSRSAAPSRGRAGRADKKSYGRR